MTGLLVGQGYGRRVGLRVTDGRSDAVRAVLPFWWVDDAGSPEVVRDVDAGSAERVVRDLELWVAEHAVDRVFVHAGVVVFDGRALLLPGRSMAGKTTLVAALLRAGAEYLSDEYAVLDGDGLVHPYPRPLSVRAGDRRRPVSAAEFGARTATTPMPVGALAALTYRAGSPWSTHPVSRAAAVLHLLDNAVAARSAGRQVLRAVSAAVGDASCVAGRRGDAGELPAGELPALLTHG